MSRLLIMTLGTLIGSQVEERDFEDIIHSEKLFARKLDMNANGLFDMLSIHRQANI